jgi:aromatic ring-cleaving dioxygenase
MIKNLRLDRKATYQIKLQGDASANLIEWLEGARVELDHPVGLR